MCGEHQNASRLSHGPLGSSPHVRGALRPSATIGLGCGIIPACAGSTTGVAASAKVTRDHPRMCGEHGRLATMPCRSPGSSPHVRGAQRLERQSCSLSGIIPACAGSTRTYAPSKPLTRDHPRMCGEHFTTTGSPYCSSGSSPHVRGAPTGDLLGVTIGGIIPACAGSTPTATRPSREPRDHPRMCGEHLPDVSLAVPLPGSSPHVRGARPCLPLVAEPCGIIPACAGSTAPHGRTARPKRDHPRMCGEHSFVANP